MARMLSNKKKKTVLFLESILELHITKATLATNAEISLLGENSNVNGNDMSGDLRRLCKEGRLKEAFHILHVMDHRGIRPDSLTYASLLQGCANKKALQEGKSVHIHMTESGFKPDVFLGNTLVSMYVKCGSLVDARRVLDEMPERNVVSWTALIAAYARHGYSEKALTVFNQMQRTGIQPNQFTFASVLPACANLEALEHGKQIHEDIVRSGFQYNVFVGSALVDMYIKCQSIADACHVFDKMPERNVVSWNTLIAGYARKGYVDEALKLFQKMPERNVVSWTAMIAGYAQNGHVEEAMKLFQIMPERNVVSWTAMITGYAQNGHVDEALNLFQSMPEQNVISWNAIITGFLQNGRFDESLNLFRQMQLNRVKPDLGTYASIMSACANLAAFAKGKEVHEDLIRSGFHSHVFLGNALVGMYVKCDTIENARKVFDKMSERNVVSWNVMIAGYAKCGNVEAALKLFQEMPERNVVTWTAMIAGYAQNGLVEEASELFQMMPERNVVSWTAMISGYAQNGHVDEAVMLFQNMPERNVISWNAMVAVFVQNGYFDEAMKLFQKMPERDVVSWTAIIAGYSQNGYFDDCIKLFQQMQLTGVKPVSDTFASVLPACANLAALKHGQKIHDNIIKSGFESDVFVGNALIDMYAKCGIIEDAHRVFDKMLRRDVVSWNAMVVGYAMHGCGNKALQLFEEMRYSDTNPDHVTFVGVLSACRHTGQVDAGWQYFDCMSSHYYITPAMEHYCCMVDLLGRAGLLLEAQDFIDKMPIEPDAAVWGSLLGACRIHTNIELGEKVAGRLFELDPKNAASYVVLSNIYAAAGRWEDIEKLQKMMKDRSIKKKPGCSWIEVNNKVHTFLLGDRSHPQSQKIYAELEALSEQMKESGYVPNTAFVLYDVEEEQKEHVLCHHSEKLAIAFGLINTPPGTPIRIVKNLRVCGDCHTATKFISKIVSREIVVRDANRFHHFEDGHCSCKDYW